MEYWEEFRNFAFVLGLPDEPTERVALTCPAAEALGLDVPQFATRSGDVRRAFSQRLEIQWKRSRSIQRG